MKDVGQTWVLKKVLLNSLVNYLNENRFEDKFLYKIINKRTNQIKHTAKHINIYYIQSNNRNYPIKIIDSPGFVDIRGIEMESNLQKKKSRVY